MTESIKQATTQIANDTDLKHNLKRYLVYRNGNTEKPDEIIETTPDIQAELVNKLRSDPTITRVDLQIVQVFTWTNYLSFANKLESTIGNVEVIESD